MTLGRVKKEKEILASFIVVNCPTSIWVTALIIYIDVPDTKKYSIVLCYFYWCILLWITGPVKADDDNLDF